MSRTYPHCDRDVLHAPGSCEVCDDYAPDLQRERVAKGIRFTGEVDMLKEPCPATLRRSPEVIHRWGGNRPHRGPTFLPVPPPEGDL